MKWLIASDVHGSAYWCKKLVEAYKREEADRLLLLGDVLYHGPRNDLPRDYDPKAVIAMLNPLASEIVCVRGNCESEVDAMVLDFPVLADYALISEEALGGSLIFATHGHLFNASKLPPLKRGDILIHGHTHVPCFEQKDGVTILNPGSVSIPKEGSVESYMVLNGAVFTRKSLDGSILSVHSFIKIKK